MQWILHLTWLERICLESQLSPLRSDRTHSSQVDLIVPDGDERREDAKARSAEQSLACHSRPIVRAGQSDNHRLDVGYNLLMGPGYKFPRFVVYGHFESMPFADVVLSWFRQGALGRSRPRPAVPERFELMAAWSGASAIGLDWPLLSPLFRDWRQRAGAKSAAWQNTPKVSLSSLALVFALLPHPAFSGSSVTARHFVACTDNRVKECSSSSRHQIGKAESAMAVASHTSGPPIPVPRRARLR